MQPKKTLHLSMLKLVAGDTYEGQDLATMDWVSIMKAYLMKHGMTETDLSNWYAKLTD